MHITGKIGLLGILAMTLALSGIPSNKVDASDNRDRVLASDNQILATGGHVSRFVGQMMQTVDEYAGRTIQVISGVDFRKFIGVDDQAPDDSILKETMASEMERRDCRRDVFSEFTSCMNDYLDNRRDPQVALMCGYEQVINSLKCDQHFLQPGKRKGSTAPTVNSAAIE